MASPEHFIEAHYYAGGLRHQSYSEGGRPLWAPAEDSVGFQDEFPLAEGDTAVELRRFELGEDRVTWIAIYYPSVDTKLGDRRNHAGVGIWLRNGVVSDPAAFLYGLNTLAQFLAKSVDAKALGAHVEKFVERAFLPGYLKDLDGYPFAKGAPWAPLGMVDTQQYFVSCAMGVGDCRSLSDYMLNLTLFAVDPSLRPRSLVLVSPAEHPPKAARDIIKIPDDFDAGSIITVGLPAIFHELTERALSAETDVSKLKSRLAELESDSESLRAQYQEAMAVRDDPQSVILRKLDEISSRLDGVGGHRSAPTPLPWTSPTIPKRPITTRTSHATTPEYETDWIKVAAVAILVLLIPTLIYLIYLLWS